MTSVYKLLESSHSESFDSVQVQKLCEYVDENNIETSGATRIFLQMVVFAKDEYLISKIKKLYKNKIVESKMELTEFLLLGDCFVQLWTLYKELGILCFHGCKIELPFHELNCEPLKYSINIQSSTILMNLTIFWCQVCLSLLQDTDTTISFTDNTINQIFNIIIQYSTIININESFYHKLIMNISFIIQCLIKNTELSNNMHSITLTSSYKCHFIVTLEKLFDILENILIKLTTDLDTHTSNVNTTTAAISTTSTTTATTSIHSLYKLQENTIISILSILHSIVNTIECIIQHTTTSTTTTSMSRLSIVEFIHTHIFYLLSSYIMPYKDMLVQSEMVLYHTYSSSTSSSSSGSNSSCGSVSSSSSGSLYSGEALLSSITVQLLHILYTTTSSNSRNNNSTTSSSIKGDDLVMNTSISPEQVLLLVDLALYGNLIIHTTVTELLCCLYTLYKNNNPNSIHTTIINTIRNIYHSIELNLEDEQLVKVNVNKVSTHRLNTYFYLN